MPLGPFFFFSILPRDLYNHLEVHACIHGFTWKSRLFVSYFAPPLLDVGPLKKARHVYTKYFALLF